MSCVRLPEILVCYAFVGEQEKCNDERKLDDSHSAEENEKGLNNVPQESNARSEVNFGQLIYAESGFVNNVEVKAEQPAPDDKKCYVTTTHRGGKKEFEADYGSNKDQWGYIFRVEE